MVASFVGKIFVIRPPTTKTTNILPHENYPLYGTHAKEHEVKKYLGAQEKLYCTALLLHLIASQACLVAIKSQLQPPWDSPL